MFPGSFPKRPTTPIITMSRDVRFYLKLKSRKISSCRSLTRQKYGRLNTVAMGAGLVIAILPWCRTAFSAIIPMIQNRYTR